MLKKVALSLCFTLFLGLLTSCSPEGILHLKKTESLSEKTKDQAQSTSVNEGIGTPVALPPSFGNEAPTYSGMAENTYMPNGLPALKPPKGVNVDTLFSENIKDSERRFERVEGAVVDLRKEFEVYRPSIVRLAAVEADIQNLVKELEVLLQETPANQQAQNLNEELEGEAQLQVSQLDPHPPPVPEVQKDVPQTVQGEAPMPLHPVQMEEDEPIVKKPVRPEKPPEPKRKAAEKLSYDGVIARNLRVGEHADYVRIVLNTSERVKFSVDLDNEERLIIIELSDVRWIDAMNQSFAYAKLISSYSVEEINDGKGVMIILSLNKETEIIRQKRLQPDKSADDHRIYFDLKL